MNRPDAAGDGDVAGDRNEYRRRRRRAVVQVSPVVTRGSVGVTLIITTGPE
jgi:hypothetical protein